ncbi:MAG: C40 family peptidase [Paraclostridium sp.]|uniref:C40 family peptidase n=1 Tax=Paraclostridium sp. TaxID=2023273 RepID=UPI003F3CB9AB
MDVNQLVTIKLLNAMNQANSNNKDYSNSQTDIFDLILENTLGGLGSLGSSGQTCNCNCHHSNQSGLDTLNTLLSSINNNKISTSETDEKVSVNNIDANKNKINTSENNIKEITVGNISPTDKMDDAVKLIESKVGNEYVWGATGPETFDCSGLVQYVYKNALGKNIPRTSYEQSKFGQSVDKQNLQVGDLVFFDTMGKGRVSHVGMYVGNNEFVHAANENDGIKKSKLTGYYSTHYKGARRP